MGPPRPAEERHHRCYSETMQPQQQSIQFYIWDAHVSVVAQSYASFVLFPDIVAEQAHGATQRTESNSE